MNIPIYTLNESWISLLYDVINYGKHVYPRGQKTRELLHQTVAVNMRHPVLTITERKLSYQFMAAEAYWILSGDNQVSTIAPWNKNIAQFSDDGETFFGAYGPRIMSQLTYVLDKLREDPWTRQAGLTIWIESPPKTKDVPCTITIFFNVREQRLNCHVFMRSSDVWLGLPYDVFNFSMLSHLVCGYLRPAIAVEPGSLFLTTASSHLYERDFNDAIDCLHTKDGSMSTNKTPAEMYCDPGALYMKLLNVRSSKKSNTTDRWWL